VEPSVESAIRAIAPVATSRFGLELTVEAVETLARFGAELLRWNLKFNLTSISDPKEVAELHILDSLAVAPFVPTGSTVLDIGTGGGFPGLPLAIVRPDLDLRLVDRTEKKVLFLKTTLARLRIRNARAMQVRVEGKAESEGLAQVDVAVSRAFAAPEPWLALARQYVRPGGRILAMLGSEQPGPSELEAMRGPGDGVIALHRYELPSGAKRAIVVLDRGSEGT